MNRGIFLLCEDYQGVYTNALGRIPNHRSLSYGQLLEALLEQGFFYGNAYLEAIRKAGIPAFQAIPQCAPLQKRWARENGLKLPPLWLDRFIIRGISRRLLKIHFPSSGEMLFRFTTAQLKVIRPQVLWVFSGVPVTPAMLSEWRKHCGHMILWYSCPLTPDFPFSYFDAVFSSIESLVEKFRSMGLRSFLIRHAFDRNIANRISPVPKRRRKAVFVGSLNQAHRDRVIFLDRLSRVVDIDYYGPDCGCLPADSPLRKNYRGPAWGQKLYQVYGSYLVALHANISVAGTYPSAKRIFESTGMGACLITHTHDKLPELFEPGKEIIGFADFEDCAGKIKHLLANPEIAEQIGRLGQARTLRDHHYEDRVGRILEICRRELGAFPLRIQPYPSEPGPRASSGSSSGL